jgi:hypothetical protein
MNLELLHGILLLLVLLIILMLLLAPVLISFNHLADHE